MINYIGLSIELGNAIICCIFLNDALRKNRPFKTIVICSLLSIFNFVLFGNSIYMIIQSLI